MTADVGRKYFATNTLLTVNWPMTSIDGKRGLTSSMGVKPGDGGRSRGCIPLQKQFNCITRRGYRGVQTPSPFIDGGTGRGGGLPPPPGLRKGG